ncbi:MAG: hypothetical protein EOM26_11600 [Alphaproteobacteria bacterium]|nr:hypothetical protein [Alphaproteobacteria bacterium]
MVWFVAPFLAGYLAGNWMQDRVDRTCSVRAGTGSGSPGSGVAVSVSARHVSDGAEAGARHGFTFEELVSLFGRGALAAVAEGREPQVLLGRALINDTDAVGQGVVEIDRVRGRVQDVWIAAGARQSFVFAIGNKTDGFRNLVFRKLAGRYYPRNAKGTPVRRSDALAILAEMVRVQQIHNDRKRRRTTVRTEDGRPSSIRLAD